MIELFGELRSEFKKQAAFVVDLALAQDDLLKAISMIKNFSDVCNESEKDFIEFYLELRKAQLEGEQE